MASARETPERGKGRENIDPSLQHTLPSRGASERGEQGSPEDASYMVRPSQRIRSLLCDLHTKAM